MKISVKYYNYVPRVCWWFKGKSWNCTMTVDRFPTMKSDLISLIANAKFTEFSGRYEDVFKRDLIKKISSAKSSTFNANCIELYYYDAGKDMIVISRETK